MRATWHALHEQLVARSSHLRFQRTFDQLRDGDPALHQFPDLAALLDHQQHGTAPHDARNKVVFALIRAAQTGHSQTATLVLILALWPGLDGVFAYLRRFCRGDDETLAGELLSRISSAILTCKVEAITQPAATLLMNLKRDMIRDAKAEQGHVLGHQEFDEFAIEALNQPDIPTPESALDSATFIRSFRRVLGSDADLVLAVLFEGLTQAEAAARFGIKPDAARKRYQHAIQKLAGIISG